MKKPVVLCIMDGYGKMTVITVTQLQWQKAKP